MAHSLNYNAGRIALGPGALWVGLALPATGARLTLDANGYPDQTENPNAINVGLTKAGAKLSFRTTLQSSEADVLRNAERTILSAQACAIEGEFLQVLDFTVLQRITAATALTGTGYEGITLGSDQLVTPTAAALIWPLVDAPTKYAVWMLYRCVNEPGLEFTLTRRDQSAVAYRLVGQRIHTRSDQLGQFWRQT